MVWLWNYDLFTNAGFTLKCYFFFENRLQQPTPYCGEARAIANLVNLTEGSIAYIPTPLNVTTNI